MCLCLLVFPFILHMLKPKTKMVAGSFPMNRFIYPSCAHRKSNIFVLLWSKILAKNLTFLFVWHVDHMHNSGIVSYST